MVGQIVKSRSNLIFNRLVESIFVSQLVGSISWILKFQSHMILDQLVKSLYQYNLWSLLVGYHRFVLGKLEFFLNRLNFH